jgi:hypothetical protein
MSNLASVQETALDIAWIRDGVVSFGARRGERSYRAVLSVEGPPEAFAPESERAAGALGGFASFLSALEHPLQVLVLPRPANLDHYAEILERRARTLPPHLATHARADAQWAREAGPHLGLLDRRAYVVVPPEEMVPEKMLGRLKSATRFVRRGHAAELDEVTARNRLDERCAALADRLWRGGVWSERLDDAALARLFHVCWSAWRHGTGDARADRFARDLGAYAGAAAGVR